MIKYKNLGCLLFLAALFFLTSCKTDKNDKSQTPEIKETEKLTVTSRLRAEPDRLNPVLTWRGWSIQVNNHIFSPLIEHDRFTSELSPFLAKSRPEVKQITEGPYAGGTKFTFEILEEAKWDNGQPILATDYAFTVKALMNPNAGGVAAVFRSALNIIKDVEYDSNNPRKFTVTIFPFSFRGEYSAGAFNILPEYKYDAEGLLKGYSLSDLVDPKKSEELLADPNLQKHGVQFISDEFSRNVVSGSGAYALDEWVSGEKIVLKRKENWWGNDLWKTRPLLMGKEE